MKARISVLIITKNNEETIGEVINSVKNFDEIVVVDSNSEDKTLEKIQMTKSKYQIKSKIQIYKKEFDDIGKQRAYGLRYVTGDWVLVLDSDEVISSKLREEIKLKIKNEKLKIIETAFEISYQNYFLGRRINYGGENYKMIRLFRKEVLESAPSIVHNKLIVKKGKIGRLKGKIHHYSYRSLKQVYTKFTDYSVLMARVKAKEGEKSSFKKIFLYPLHMFWARFIEDKGYKDGLFRIPLDLGFAYMEFLTYFLLFFRTRERNFYQK